ncbi:MAG: hypothetical protein ACRDV3_09720 [Acidothermaceae bacterium]
MASSILEWIAIVIGALFVVLVVVFIVEVSRQRPRFDRRRGPAPYRVRGRSIRGWQASAIREIRRAGRQHGSRSSRSRRGR